MFELRRLYVKPDVQRQGVGRRLLEAVIQAGRIKSMYAWVEQKNEIGRAFYARRGFVKVNERKEDFWERSRWWRSGCGGVKKLPQLSAQMVHLVDPAAGGGVPLGDTNPPIFLRRSGITGNDVNMQMRDVVSDAEYIDMFGLNQ